jgi:hypothetical protein
MHLIFPNDTGVIPTSKLVLSCHSSCASSNTNSNLRCIRYHPALRNLRSLAILFAQPKVGVPLSQLEAQQIEEHQRVPMALFTSARDAFDDQRNAKRAGL